MPMQSLPWSAGWRKRWIAGLGRLHMVPTESEDQPPVNSNIVHLSCHWSWQIWCVYDRSASLLSNVHRFFDRTGDVVPRPESHQLHSLNLVHLRDMTSLATALATANAFENAFCIWSLFRGHHLGFSPFQFGRIVFSWVPLESRTPKT